MIENQLLVNPKLGSEERKIFECMQEYFEKKFGQNGFIFVPSSGSSKSEGESAKLIALTRDAVANSAERFNQYFRATSDDNWGLVLPTFHVAGLSILARANLVKARVYKSDWSPAQMQEWFEKNQIAFLSLVPTQVHDLVIRRVKAPSSLKKVFVGGGALQSALRDQFLRLSWPLVETYGMTETCSMIAVKEGELSFKVMPGVEVFTEDGVLRIKCNSVAHSSIQMKNGKIQIQHFESGWVHTEDQVQIEKREDAIYLQFLGRATDYIKIMGEGVSLLELRDKLDKLASEIEVQSQQKFLLSVPDARQENAMVLVIEKAMDIELADRLVQRFNEVVRGYERIHKIVRVDQIPFSDLGKVKAGELKEIVLKNLNAETK